MGRVSQLANHFLDAVDMAAIASANWRGKGDKMAADAAAVEAMRPPSIMYHSMVESLLVKEKEMKHLCCTLVSN